ncbi:MAG: head GIN domain-containing protein [bacterium]
MKLKNYFVLAIAVFTLSACHFRSVKGSGNYNIEKRNIDNFSELELSGAFDVNLIIDDKTSLEIKAEDNLMKYIKTEVHGNSLSISTKKNLNPKRKIVINITTPQLSGVSVSGANDLGVKGLKNEDFFVNLSGAGSVNVEGKTDELQVDISGAANLHAKNLIANDVRIDISGASDADVYANNSLNATVSGVGNINYYGNPPKVLHRVSGIGSIKRK